MDARRTLALAVLTMLTGLAVTAVILARGALSPEPRQVTGSPFVTAQQGRAEPAVDPASGVLERWDRRRAAAFAAGSSRRLQDLYVPRSSAAVSDLAVLESYRSRGFRVAGMRMQLLSVSVLDRAAGRWRLRVTDRLVGATAVTRDHELALPHDSASTHIVDLVRGIDHRWRVATVR